MSAAADFYDTLESRDPEARRRAQFAALPAQIAHAKAKAPRFARTLADVDPEAVASPEALAALPVLRKSDLTEWQKEEPPFGGLAATATGALGRVFASPGPIYEPEGQRADYWRTARALFAAGFRKGDLAHNSFSYHLTPGGSIMESGARALGCAVIPGGVGQTDLQLQTIADLRPNAFMGTPSFLKVLIDKAADLGCDVSSLAKASVGGEALPPRLRQELEGHGLTVLQSYATADVGLIAYESSAREGMIVDEGVILELVRPGTGDPVAEGEVGEAVVTTFNPDYPLIRFATGDLSAVLVGQSPCGRTNMRIKGWMGRADQTAKVRGMFVRPSQIAEIVRRHPEIGKARLIIDNVEHRDVMTLRCEVSDGDDALAGAIAESVQAICKVRGEVAAVAPGSLPNDGKVIDDIRKYD